MQNKRLGAGLIFALLLCSLSLVMSKAGQQPRTLILTGHAGESAVVEMGGYSNVEVQALAQLANVTLTKEFIRAGIEEMSVVRERRSTLTNAVQRGYPVTDDWIGSFRDQARTSLRLVGVAATTDSDRNGLQLLRNVFNNMNKLGDQFLEANRIRTYISPDALNNHPLDQRILNCAHSLAAMAANGQFMDDGSCH